MQEVITEIKKQSPQIAVLVPTSTKTITYGDIKESTVVFTGEKQSTVQVTTVTNTKTGKVTVLGSKILPVVYVPTKPVEILPVQPVRVVPLPAIPVAVKKYPELQSIIKEVTGKVTEITIEDFKTTKKYVTVSETTEGKVQNVFIHVVDTGKSDLIQTLPVIVETKPIYFETTTN